MGAIRGKTGSVFLGGLITALVCFCSLADAPDALDSSIIALHGQSTSVLLRVQDDDIDALDPEAHPIVFEILEGPARGVLEGDVTVVTYYAPNLAVVELSYTPDESFIGDDYIVFAATDPDGLSDIGEIRLGVQPPPAPAMDLSGSWDLYATYDGVALPFAGVVSHCSATLNWGSFELEAIAAFQGTDFTDLTFYADTGFEDVAVILATLGFDPGTASFDYLTTVASFDLGDVGFRYMFYLTTPEEDTYSQLYADAQVGAASVTNTLTLSGCGMDFKTNETRVSWRWMECDARITGTLKTSCENGFDSFRMAMSDLSLQPLLQLPIDLDVAVTYGLDEKSVSTGLSCEDFYIDCFRIYCEVVDGDPDSMAFSLDGLSLYGIEMRCTITPNVYVRSATSLAAEKNAAVVGKSDYFEVLTLSGIITGCCGLNSIWQMSAFFQEGAASLFDVGLLALSADIALVESFLFSNDLTYKLTTNEVEWVVGFEVSW